MFKKKNDQRKKKIFGQNRINFTKKGKNGKEAEKITLVWESMLKLLLYFYLNKLYIRLYCVLLYLKQSLKVIDLIMQKFIICPILVHHPQFSLSAR